MGGTLGVELSGFDLSYDLPKLCIGVAMGVFVVIAVDIREDHQQIRLEIPGDVGTETVVVSEDQLFGSHHVVFVDDGNHPVPEQCLHRIAGMPGPPAGIEIIRTQQQLGTEDPVVGELALIELEQVGLTDRRQGLFVGDPAPVQLQLGVPGGHRTGTDQDHLVFLPEKLGDKIHQRPHSLQSDRPLFRQYMGADLDHDSLHHSASPSEVFSTASSSFF